MAIEFQHISKRFADTRALEDVSLTFEEGCLLYTSDAADEL